MDNPRSLTAQRVKDGGKSIGKLWGEDAKQLVAGASRIRERAEQIEDGGDSQRRAGDAYEFHGRVMIAGEGETDIGSVHALSKSLRRKFKTDAQFFENVGRAGFTGSGAVAVFYDANSGGRDNDGGGGGDVERSAHVAAGAAGVDDDAVPFAFNRNGFFAHDGGGADEFFDGRALGGQADEQAAYLRLTGAAGHDVRESVACFIARKILAAAEFQENVAKRRRHRLES